MMKKAIWLSALAVVLVLGFLAGCSLVNSLEVGSPKLAKVIQTPTPTPGPQEKIDDQAIERALKDTLQGREDVMAFLIYQYRIDHIAFSEDYNLAVVWIALVDPDNSELVGNEPALAIAKRQEGGGWQITLQADPEWKARLAEVPDSLISPEMRAQYEPGEQKMPKAHQVFSGYRLPWKAGDAKRVTGSIGHVFTYRTCPATCMYAIDFADGTQFPVLAARGGRVKLAVWRYPDNYHEHANFLLLEDTTTNPTTYQIYYHLAQGSIPEALRVPGAEVVQGQFIGKADNTGPSTGSHLHFMVHTTASDYWGPSVDITFDDVSDNGGRPRTCMEAMQFPGYGNQCQKKDLYVSGNGDRDRPTGGISDPKADTVITSPSMTVSGWGKDDSSVASIQLMMTYNGEWQPIGLPQTTAQFSTPIDLCQADIPDGNFFLSVKVLDSAGKESDGVQGLTRLVKQYDCHPKPQPKVCEPGDGQAAIYADADFAGGCEVLNAGDYAAPEQLGEVGGNNLESIKLGKGVFATLYDEPGFAGTADYLLVSQNNLAQTPSGANRVSSLKIRALPPLPAAPNLETPLNADGLSPTDQDDLTLTWYTPIVEGATPSTEFQPEYRSELQGPAGLDRSVDWQPATAWKVGRLPVGTYTWKVDARNISGYSETKMRFVVAKADLPPVTHLLGLPGTSDSTVIHLQWSVDEGASDIQQFEIQYRVDGAGWQDWNQALPAYWTGAWFIGEPGKTYEFRMRGIDAANHPEAYPDKPEVKVKISTECVKDTYEGKANADDLKDGATPLEIGKQQTHNLCAQGDVDWFMFPAQAGQPIRIQTSPVSGNAAAVIQLYDTDGKTLLGEQWPAAFNTAAQLDWTAPAQGIYFLRVSALDDRLYGSNVLYQIKADPVGQVAPQGFLCGGLMLPILWFATKFYMKKKTEGKSE
jgi:murein DD-endopeptidase MepM/ murein hydrolase activator NlpD